MYPSGPFFGFQGTIKFRVNFCKAFFDAELIRIGSQNSLSCPFVYIPALPDWGNFCVVKGEMSLGANTAGLSLWMISGVSDYHESFWSISIWNRFLIGSERFCGRASGRVCLVMGSTNWICPL